MTGIDSLTQLSYKDTIASLQAEKASPFFIAEIHLQEAAASLNEAYGVYLQSDNLPKRNEQLELLYKASSRMERVRLDLEGVHNEAMGDYMQSAVEQYRGLLAGESCPSNADKYDLREVEKFQQTLRDITAKAVREVVGDEIRKLEEALASEGFDKTAAQHVTQALEPMRAVMETLHRSQIEDKRKQVA